jgi:hypothetical protein
VTHIRIRSHHFTSSRPLVPSGLIHVCFRRAVSPHPRTCSRHRISMALLLATSPAPINSPQGLSHPILHRALRLISATFPFSSVSRRCASRHLQNSSFRVYSHPSLHTTIRVRILSPPRIPPCPIASNTFPICSHPSRFCPSPILYGSQLVTNVSNQA